MIIPTLIELEQQYEKIKNEKFFDVDIEWHKLLHYINIVRNDIVNKNSIKFNLKKVDSKNTRKKKKIRAKSTQSRSTQSGSTQSTQSTRRNSAKSTRSGSTQSTQSTQSTRRNSAKSTRRNSAKSRRRKSAKSIRSNSAKSTQSGNKRKLLQKEEGPSTNATAVMNGGNTDLFFLGITIIGAAIYMCSGNYSEKNGAKYGPGTTRMYINKEKYTDGTPVLYGARGFNLISAIKTEKTNPDGIPIFKYKISYGRHVEEDKKQRWITETEIIDEDKIYRYRNIDGVFNSGSRDMTNSRSGSSLNGDWKSYYAANNDPRKEARYKAHKKWLKNYREEEKKFEEMRKNHRDLVYAERAKDMDDKAKKE